VLPRQFTRASSNCRAEINVMAERSPLANPQARKAVARRLQVLSCPLGLVAVSLGENFECLRHQEEVLDLMNPEDMNGGLILEAPAVANVPVIAVDHAPYMQTVSLLG
jgi:hypothetical protein